MTKEDGYIHILGVVVLEQNASRDLGRKDYSVATPVLDVQGKFGLRDHYNANPEGVRYRGIFGDK